MKLYIVDAFSERIFGGNPAGVVHLPQGMEFPDDEIMRKTAAELRYSETAFLKRLGGRRFHVRYFTPAAEVDLCGHATIAAFYTLLKSGAIAPGEPCDVKTMAGNLQVLAAEDGVLMDMGEAQSFGEIDAPERIKELCEVMGAQGCTPTHGAKTLRPEIVSTGLSDIMMPVADLAALHALSPDMDALSALSEAYGVTGVHAFTLSESDGVHCRNFAPLYDIDEEAATGTSNGALTYYLYKRGLVSPEEDVRFVQGEAMGRPSAISARLSLCQDGSVTIRVGGKAAILAEGELFL